MSKSNIARALTSAIAIGASILASSANADTTTSSNVVDDEALPGDSTVGAAQSAEESLALPFSISPRINGAAAFARAVAGYDGAVDSFIARSAAEARVLSFLSVRLDYQHGPGMGPDDRFGVGARAQLLNAEEHGIDGGVGLFYQPNDFREEGHIAAALLAGRYFGRLGVFVNTLFGGDAEGDDAAFEGRMSALYRVNEALRVGFDSRFRYNLSADAKREGTLARDWELQLLPTTSYSLGFFSFVAEAGLSALQQTGPWGTPQEVTTTDLGFTALAGVGGAF